MGLPRDMLGPYKLIDLAIVLSILIKSHYLLKGIYLVQLIGTCW